MTLAKTCAGHIYHGWPESVHSWPAAKAIITLCLWPQHTDPATPTTAATTTTSPSVGYDRKLCHDRKQDKSVIFFQRQPMPQWVPPPLATVGHLLATEWNRLPRMSTIVVTVSHFHFQWLFKRRRSHYVHLTFNDCHAPYIHAHPTPTLTLTLSPSLPHQKRQASAGSSAHSSCA